MFLKAPTCIVGVGDYVAEDELVAEIETDKVRLVSLS